MTFTIPRRRVLQAGIGLALTGCQYAFAQDKYPSRPVRIIVPLPPGGVVDNSVRALAAVMGSDFGGQPIVIDNKPGGAFVIATNALRQAPADGYTLLYVHAPYLSTQAAFRKFDLFKTVVPVAGLGETDITLSTGGKKGYRTVAELVADGKANPGKLSFSSPGPGTLEHLALVNFCKAAGIDAVHVPLKGGPEVVKALIAGEVDFGTLAVPLVLPFLADGRIRPLMLLNDKRNSAVPEVPTFHEAGIAVARVTAWGGLAAPVGTPPEVLAWLEKTVLHAAAQPELQRQWVATGMTPSAVGSAAFAKMWRDDYVWISKAVADARLENN